MSQRSTSPYTSFQDTLFGYVFSAALRVAAELGIADLLRDGPKTADELARVTGAQPGALYRVLRTLASREIFAADAEGRFCLTPSAGLLCSDAPGSLRDAVLMISSDLFWRSCGDLLQSVKTGEPTFERVFGEPLFTYFARHPADAELFNRAAAQYSRMEDAPIAHSYDFHPFPRVVDLGGGAGGLLAEILKSHPSLKGVLFDKHHTLDSSTTSGPLTSAGVADRCELVAGDFFTSVPVGDVYILKRIMHDWSDDKCVMILKNCQRVMPEGGRVLVIDAVVPAGNEPHESKVMDLLMMSLLGGRERTEQDFRSLYAAAGLTLTRVIQTPSALSIIEGVR